MNKVIQIRIIDITGRVVKTIPNPSNRILLDGLPTGTYVVHIHTKSDVLIGKILLQGA